MSWAISCNSSGQIFVFNFDSVNGLYVFNVGLKVMLIQKVILDKIKYSQLHIGSIWISFHHVDIFLDT